MSRTSKQRRDARKSKRGARRRSTAPRWITPVEGARTPPPRVTITESEIRDAEMDARLLGLLRYVHDRVDEALYDAMRSVYEELCPDDADTAHELVIPEGATPAVMLEILRLRARTAPDDPETSAA